MAKLCCFQVYIFFDTILSNLITTKVAAKTGSWRLFCECYCDIVPQVLSVWKVSMVAKYCDKLEELVKNRGYVIKVTPPPKYISAFLPDESEVILIHKLVSLAYCMICF